MESQDKELGTANLLVDPPGSNVHAAIEQHVTDAVYNQLIGAEQSEVNADPDTNDQADTDNTLHDTLEQNGSVRAMKLTDKGKAFQVNLFTRNYGQVRSTF